MVVNTGLSELTINQINTVLSLFPAVEKAILYGSRAKGHFRPGSDIDLVLIGSLIDLSIISHIKEKFESLNTPYLFDISIKHHIKNAALLEHIEKYGIEVFMKAKTP